LKSWACQALVSIKKQEQCRNVATPCVTAM
jgi:hypothetical protein